MNLFGKIFSVFAREENVLNQQQKDFVDASGGIQEVVDRASNWFGKILLATILIALVVGGAIVYIAVKVAA